MTSIFDPNAFLNTEIKGAIDTTVVPIPEGEYNAQVSRAPRFRKIDTKNGERVVMDVSWGIDDENVKKITMHDNPAARQTVFLDLTEEGAMDMSKGKNRQLGLLREAVGQNTEKGTWSPAQLEGTVAHVKVEHSPNEADPDNPFANVTRVTAIR